VLTPHRNRFTCVCRDRPKSQKHNGKTAFGAGQSEPGRDDQASKTTSSCGSNIAPVIIRMFTITRVLQVVQGYSNDVVVMLCNTIGRDVKGNRQQNSNGSTFLGIRMPLRSYYDPAMVEALHVARPSKWRKRAPLNGNSSYFDYRLFEMLVLRRPRRVRSCPKDRI